MKKRNIYLFLFTLLIFFFVGINMVDKDNDFDTKKITEKDAMRILRKEGIEIKVSSKEIKDKYILHEVKPSIYELKDNYGYLFIYIFKNLKDRKAVELDKEYNKISS